MTAYRYKLMVQRGTSEESYFMDATEKTNPLARKLWEQRMKGHSDTFVNGDECNMFTINTH